jgi:hypothetical protein
MSILDCYSSFARFGRLLAYRLDHELRFSEMACERSAHARSGKNGRRGSWGCYGTADRKPACPSRIYKPDSVSTTFQSSQSRARGESQPR